MSPSPPPSSPPHKNDASNSKEIKDRFAALLRATYASSGNLDDRFLDSKTKLTMQRYDGYEDILVQRLGRHMYKDVKEFEELKDFVMNTMTKSDLWIRRQSQPWANRARKKMEEQAEKEMKESEPETLRKRSKLFKLVTAVYDAGGENKDDVEVVKEIEQSEETELVKSLSDKFEESASSEVKALDIFVSKSQNFNEESVPEKLNASKDRKGSIVDGSSSSSQGAF